MNENRKIFMIMIKEFNVLDEKEKNPFIKFPKKLMKLLTEYFMEMQRRGLVRRDNPEAQAASLLCLSFGIFMSTMMTHGDIIEGSLDEYLSYAVKTLIRGLAP